MSENSDDMYNVPLSSDSEAGDLALRGKVYTNPADNMHNNMLSNNTIESDINADEEEEKQRLITQVLELQNTLDDLSSRVDTVKEENLKLKSENQVLGQYIENLMTASSVFQSTSPKAKKKNCSLEINESSQASSLSSVFVHIENSIQVKQEERKVRNWMKDQLL